ncbi:MAG TPA: DegV family protein [Firmicutes bacterium]|nr:DegV family protein [Bacillota bacterium]
MSIKIITDSACDLPDEIISENDIAMVPFHVLLEGVDYLDRETMQPEELYRKMRQGVMPKTAQITPLQFVEVFTRYAKEGKQCLYIAFSSKMSGTCNIARLAAQHVKSEHPDYVIEIIDSECGALAQGLAVWEAAKMAQAGKPLQEIVAAITLQCRHTEHIFSVDDLEYLFRGGRVDRISSFVGTLLNVKPILNVKEGCMIPIEKVRGKAKAMNRIVELMAERGSNLQEQIIAINHADDLQSALKLKAMIEERFSSSNFVINTVGCVLGSHIGIGGVAAFFLNKDYYRLNEADCSS